MKPARPTSRTTLPLLLLTGLALAAAGCGEGSPTGPGEEIEGLPRSLSATELQLVDAGNDFAFRFLDQVYQASPDSNLFIAPLSASMALGMTMNGAAGNTFDEMRSTLGFGTLTLDQINQGYRDLIDLLLELDPRVELGIGNSIWYRQGFSVKPDFLQRTEDAFGAEVRGLNFGDPGSVTVINDWVKDQTRGKIDAIVEAPIDAATVMFLINAVYFKGDWTHRFPKDKTRNADFLPPWSSFLETIPMMQLDDTLPYAETELYQAVDLPYGGKAFSMTVIVPKGFHTAAEVVATLDAGSFAQLAASLQPKEGTVFLPRFRMEWEQVLNGTLQGMGMVDAFIPGTADFSGITEEFSLFISKVKQKTYVDVNEEGTEAAGVTSVEIRVTSVPDRFTFRADRPFVFLIRERFSQTILFAGVLVHPPEA